jgi:hypothetical protein
LKQTNPGEFLANLSAQDARQIKMLDLCFLGNVEHMKKQKRTLQASQTNSANARFKDCVHSR